MSNAIRLVYTEYPRSRTTLVLRPVTPFGFEYEGNRLPGFYCLIDSGADITISFKIIGLGLGINFTERSLESISGIGGRIRCPNPHCDKIIEKIKCPKCKQKFNPELFAYQAHRHHNLC